MFFYGMVFTLLTGLVWTGVGVVYGRAAMKDGGFFTFLFISSCFFALTSWLVTPPSPASPGEVGSIAALMIPAGIAGQLGFLALRKAMRHGSHSISWCIAQSAMVCPVVAGLVFWHEHISWFRLLGVILLLGSLAPLSQPAKKTDGITPHKSFLYFAFMAFFLCGLQQTISLVPNRLPGISDAALSWRVPLVSLCGLGWGGAVLYYREHAWKTVVFIACGYGALVAVGQWTFFRAVDFLSGVGSTNIVYPLAIGSSIVLFFFYDRLVGRGRGGQAGIIGITLAIVGILLIAF